MTTYLFSSLATMLARADFAVYIACALLMGLIFYIDTRVPLGVAIGSLYILVVLLALWSRRARFIYIVAAVSSVLVVGVWIYKPAVEEMGKVVFNRGLALFIIWATALLCLKIRAAQHELVRIASYDFLTGVLNRREMFNRLSMEMSRVDRVDHALSVIILDIDHFKDINDRYGHQAGDDVLKEMAGILKEHLRKYDYICRYGGEEFLVVAPETPLPVAHDLAERLRLMVMQAKFTPSNSPPIAITISAGVAQQVKGELVASLISRADAALYEAKEAGRNRVVVARSDEQSVATVVPPFPSGTLQ